MSTLPPATAVASAASLTAPSIRRPEIDGIRAVVSIWVMCDHFGLSRLVGMHYGFLAVRLMLVLSAYFAAKQLRCFWASGPSTPVADRIGKLVHYYSSRVIRLGLLCYTTIFLALLLDSGLRGTWPWHAAFATNLYIAHHGEWPGALSHLWSLAVQMQFLLVLPVVLLLVSRRGFWAVVFVGIVAAVGHRASVFYGGATDYHRWMLVANSLDAFALGLGLAWVERERPRWFALLLNPWAGVLALVSLIASLWLRATVYHLPHGIFTETLEAVALVIFFGALLGGRRFGPIGMALRFKPFVVLGTASLSIYALHPIAHQLLTRFWTYANVESVIPSPLVFQWSAVFFSLAVAWVAYQLLEMPARKFASAVEPILTRTAIRVAAAAENWRGGAWQGQPVGTMVVVLLLGYSAVAPIFLPHTQLNEAPPLAIEEMEESLDDLPSLYWLESPDILFDEVQADPERMLS